MKQKEFIGIELPFNGSLQREQSTYQQDHARMVSLFTSNKEEDTDMLSQEVDHLDQSAVSSNMFNKQQDDLGKSQNDFTNRLQSIQKYGKIKQVGFLAKKVSLNADDSSKEIHFPSFQKSKVQIQSQKTITSQNVQNSEGESEKIQNSLEQSQRQILARRNQYFRTNIYEPQKLCTQKAFIEESKMETPILRTQLNQQIAGKQAFSLFVMLKIKLLACKFLSLLNKERFKLLRKFHFAVINDAALSRQQTEYYFTKKEGISNHQQMMNQKYLKNQGKYEQLKQFMRKYNLRELKRYMKIVSEYQILKVISDSIPLFSPSGLFATIWNISQAAIILQQFIQIPLFIVFGEIALTIFGNVSTVIFCLQILDILVQLNMKCYQKGIPVKSRFKILVRYLKQNALIDALGLVPVLYKFLIYEQGTSSKYSFSDKNHFFLLIYFFKVNHLNKHVKKIEESFYMKNLDNRSFIVQSTQFLKLLCKIVIITHIFCCIWVYVAKYQFMLNPENQNTWVDRYVISDFTTGIQSKWYELYLVAYYFSTVTMVTVGYGDIKPNSQIEIVLSIITILISCVVFAYCLNCIGNILRERNKHQEKLQKQIMIINKYMSKKAISFDLQYQIREYLEFYCTELLNQNYQEKQVIDMLNEQLQEQLMVEANNIIIKQSSIFKNNFSQNVIINTIKLIKEMRLTPKDVVYNQGDFEDQYIYFIEQGKVEQYFQIRQGEKNSSQNLIKYGEFTKGQSFGEYEFFTNQPRQATIKLIKRSEFVEMIKQFPEDYEKFSMLKDKLLNYQNYELIGQQCISCYKTCHLTNECSLLNYQPNKLAVINRGKNLRQERQQFQRNKKSKIGISNLYAIQDNVDQFIENNLSFIEGISIYNYDTDDEEYQEEEITQNLQSSQNQDYQIQNEQKKLLTIEKINEIIINPKASKYKYKKAISEEDCKIPLKSYNRLSLIAEHKNHRNSIQLKSQGDNKDQDQIIKSQKSRNEFPQIEIEKIQSLNQIFNEQNSQASHSQVFPKKENQEQKKKVQNVLDILKKNITQMNETSFIQFRALDKKIQSIHELICQQNLQQEINNQHEESNSLELDVLKNFSHYFIEGNSDDIIKILQLKSKRNQKGKLQQQEYIRKQFHKNTTLIDKFKSSKTISEQPIKLSFRTLSRLKESRPQTALNSNVISFGKQ